MQNKGYPEEFIKRVRDASNIVDIAKGYLPLKQKGQDFWACCPFHSEKTPSFAISAPKQFYYCYGCHVSGNVFSLVMKMENLSWREAVEHLAKKANIELPQTADNSDWLKLRQKKEKIYQALMLARDYYCRTLQRPANRAAVEYLHQRGIDDELIKLFHIGYSDSWQGVVDELKSHGISEQSLQEAGIVAKNEHGRIWDAQFERITFAIHDVYGNCIGFTGRTMKKDENLAKYKNTAETMVFNKSNIVYGVDVMKEKTRGQGMAGLIVVEGNVDEIAMVKNGFPNTVACMGTALTKFHAGIMARFSRVVYLCLDGDNAGQHATLKSIDVLQNAGLAVKVVVLPDGQDPDEFLQTHGAAAMQKMLANSMGGMEFKLDYLKKHSDLTNRVGKAEYLNQAVALLAEIPTIAERELYLSDVAEAVGVTVEAIRNTLLSQLSKKEIPIKNKNNAIYSGNYGNNNHNIPKRKVPPKVLAAEAVITKAVLHDREYARDFPREELPTLHNVVYQKIVAEGLKLKDIYDILDEKELAMIDPPLLDERTEQSAQDEIAEWQDCFNLLRKSKLEQQRDAATDIATKAKIIKQIKALEKAMQQQKVEDM